MSVRQLCRQTSKRASKALFLFPEEQKTGIAPTRLIVEKDLDYIEGQSVHVSWEGKKVQAEILALSSKYQSYVLKSVFPVSCSFRCNCND